MHYCPFCEAELADYTVSCNQCKRVLSATTTIDEGGEKRCSLAVEDIEQQDTVVVCSPLAVRDIEQQDTLVVRSQEAVGEKGRSLAVDDVQPLTVSMDSSLVSTLYHKILGHLPMPMQRVIAAVLSRARDPKPEVFPTSHTSDE